MSENLANEGFVEGTLTISTKGIGYVRNKELVESIEIDPRFFNTGTNGDLVRVRLHPVQAGTPQTGEVVEVLVRSKAGFSGVLEEDSGAFFLVPSDIKMYTDILIPKDKLAGAKPGQKVFGIITEWRDPRKAPHGEIIQVLGMPKENDAEMQAIALEKGFRPSFPAAVMKEAEDIGERGITEDDFAGRRDFRETLTFTIDPSDAKDFDDALSFKKLDGGRYEIGIHIADVSHYVRPGMALDREAAERATSVYLVDRTIPMLPEVLSNDLCSLKPDVIRLAFSAVFVMDDAGTVHDSWYGRTVIRSDKRFTYEEAQDVLDGAQDGPHREELSILNAIAKKLLDERFRKGAISLETDEVRFVLDEKGVPIKVYKKVRGDTHKMIEEFMLLANRKVAEHVATLDENKEKVFIYRIHDQPDRDRMEDLKIFLGKLGYKLDANDDGDIPAKEINQLLAKLDGKEEKDMINTAVVRSMAKAIYSTKNIGHYGLAFEYYTHFTSPIRRYPDVMVHRLLAEYLAGSYPDRDEWHTYELLSESSSYREKEAAEAERASVKYKQVEYMSYRIGQTYDGVISGIAKWGIFVEEAETKCEGLVKLRDIGNDFYVFDEKEMMIVGQSTKKTFRIGDKVKIKVANADMEKKIIDYVFA